MDLQNYRMLRHLSPEEKAQLVAQYRSGKSTYALARQFKIHRRTVVQHLQRAGVEIPLQLKMTPDVLERAKRLYIAGQSLAMIGGQLGVDATTVHKAFKRAGVKMRDTHGREK